MAKEKENKNLAYLLTIIAVSFIIAVYFIFRQSNLSQPISYNQPTPTNTQSSSQIFSSKKLKFRLQVTDNWQVKEDLTFVNLISEKGKINISRIATNFDTVDTYLKDFDSKRNINVAEVNYLKIDGYNAISRIEVFNAGPITKQKVYFIYIDNWVYSVSTSFPALFPVLDQIAQSFRYTP